MFNDSDPDGDPLTITGVNGATNGAVDFNSQTGVISFTPTAGYNGQASFSYTVSDGVASSSATVNMNVAPPETAESLFSTSTRRKATASDSGSVELGVKFTSRPKAAITGMRYYKGLQDTGTHVGSLWTSTGTLLAQATFTNESPSGWQTVHFAQPVTVSAGATYVASYHSNGYYAVTPGIFLDQPYQRLADGAVERGERRKRRVRLWHEQSISDEQLRCPNYWVDVLLRAGAQMWRPVANDDPGFSVGHNTAFTFQPRRCLPTTTTPTSTPCHNRRLKRSERPGRAR